MLSRKEIDERLAAFESHFTKGDDCWIWRGTKTKAGYGRFYLDSKRRVMAHRFSLLLYRGVETPDDLCVCHECDTPSCVNPDHLWVGTKADNNDDMLAKGRRSCASGEQHGAAVLTEKQVAAIRSECALGTTRLADIAARYGVSAVAIRQIARGDTWQSSPGPRSSRSDHRNQNTYATHCKRGHEFTVENTRLYHGRRYCRACARERYHSHRRLREGVE